MTNHEAAQLLNVIAKISRLEPMAVEAYDLAIAALREREKAATLKNLVELFMFEFSDLDEIVGGRQGKYIREHFDKIEKALAAFDVPKGSG